MEAAVNPLHRPPHCARVRDIAADQGGAGGEVLDPAGGEVVENDDLIPAGDERLREMRADEAAPTSDEMTRQEEDPPAMRSMGSGGKRRKGVGMLGGEEPDVNVPTRQLDRHWIATKAETQHNFSSFSGSSGVSLAIRLQVGRIKIEADRSQMAVNNETTMNSYKSHACERRCHWHIHPVRGTYGCVSRVTKSSISGGF
ncbi:hypothetical protein FHS88_003352 [Roseomonas alkaliterrae]|uniref:Uncharacterized protein n=1 Tax=Neoroseomonas alkaliterrae TaxID=1452450 RepID=A0A840XVR1_9PROT|nr:hypothetical protein [Neoroseomonas alkaliterrae]